MLVPGGRVDPLDRDERAAAERQTREEAGWPVRPDEKSKTDAWYLGTDHRQVLLNFGARSGAG
jgi:8-oxo-dGTP pyrophosphatase MutT (NUDIX family)